jgi:hypothetical protein
MLYGSYNTFDTFWLRFFYMIMFAFFLNLLRANSSKVPMYEVRLAVASVARVLGYNTSLTSSINRHCMVSYRVPLTLPCISDRSEVIDDFFVGKRTGNGFGRHVASQNTSDIADR